MYTIRLARREISSRERIDRFIEGCSVVRLGMISCGEPYVIPLNFVYNMGTLCFHCSRDGRKIEALRKNPRVCLEFDEMHGVNNLSADTLYTSAIAWGSAVEEKNLEKAVKTLELISRKYLDRIPEITREMAMKTCIVSVFIETVTGKENCS